MYKIGLSSCGQDDFGKFFEECQKSGIELVEISPKNDSVDNLNYSEIKEISKKYNIKLWSFHLPFCPFDKIDISNPDLRKSSVKYIEEFIKKGSDIGIDKFIIHPSGEPIDDIKRSERMKFAKESLKKLAECAFECGSVIAVEDLPRSCLGKNSDEIIELISVDDRLMVCFDTNHLLNENPLDFIHKVGKRIITTHISDYDLINERHWLPGEGKLEWQSLLHALEKIKYDGVWLYEVGFKCPKTIIRPRSLNCTDFIKNANEIFSNEPITVFSKHIKNLGMWGPI